MAAPLRISEHVYALPIEASLLGAPTTIFPALILDERRGASLVDAGLPGREGAFGAALEALGLGWRDLKRVIVTHHDLDHIGSLPAVVAASGAQVLALEAEMPYVQGDRPGQKQPSPQMVSSLPPEMVALFNNPPRARVDRALHDGERLDLAGGVRVVATPGHTVGHLSLFVEQDGVLIAGDALTSEDGQLRGPLERATPDLPEALNSVRKLAELPVTTVLTYHGGAVREDAAGQLTRLAGGLGH
ncbi:MBL fold metallo-hydrolase [Deinococcus metallilatus]|uniref:Glyoxylase-like metal-dependent hydrolase (Beta-lactamase superfamily II) n=1 Tax=Deinococcus metallilatus TaxID=1211322 RepID=A0AAJ5F6G1_9DEIO|nr:MBL fold metallo-hydrolase [Deinococcus metallilatus]MBB5294559.1 glyoxylase-like metal-dependent hydrolase (beta-lactamase superfamily II) [Deinococcus metallilatus]QBY07602.1 MBL fold metallo-hydrolase [Deinococcus metallilatus]RXJ14018.1 MBL fold metallo-hydrolase [Deinococcus metallilatus]TLK29983.1 MBL fold metallo-hydrolase [Deinococcus metallilatus]GMA15772.1 hydrolase [Deinococcus metallilatus]